MKKYIPSFILVCTLAFSCSFVSAQHNESKKTFKIAFGSCSRHEKAQPLWTTVYESDPDVWIWLGDIVYGDTEDMTLLRQKYDIQKSHPDYQKIREKSKIIGVWDDHDYGVNDGGKSYPKKEESQQILLDFLDVSPDSPLRKQKGAYSSHSFAVDGQEIKVILLDARYFRDSLQRVDRVYQPNLTGEVLGEEQWKWLENELKNSKAALHIIGSGIQFIPEEHPYEKWANFPAERKRFFDLLAKTQTQNVILISGDRHMSEIAQYEDADLKQPVYEVTSSGLTNVWSSYREEPNKYRIGDIVIKINFGILEIDFTNKKPAVQASIIGENNTVLLKQTLDFE
ncbi:MAG: alkaline phosphatase D family protein [Microscillaceae bacterium]|nr:alkaline phosphatase D family protein [Microscillaceae bacterium]